MSSNDWFDICNLFGDVANVGDCDGGFVLQSINLGDDNECKEPFSGDHSLSLQLQSVDLPSTVDVSKDKCIEPAQEASLIIPSTPRHISHATSEHENHTVTFSEVVEHSLPDYIYGEMFDKHDFNDLNLVDLYDSPFTIFSSFEDYELVTTGFSDDATTNASTNASTNSSTRNETPVNWEPSENPKQLSPSPKLSKSEDSTKTLFKRGIKKPKRKPGRRSMQNLTNDEFNSLLQKLSRFRLNPAYSPYIKVSISTTHFLGCDITYNEFPGIDVKVLHQPKLINVGSIGEAIHESRILCHLKHVSCSDQRKKYVRNLEYIATAVSNIRYEENADFCYEKPYQPQWLRFEMDNDGNRINATKCGLCPFCRETKFYDLGSSGYLGHLTTEHGIFSNSYLVPEGLNCGQYDTGVSIHKAIECPQCHAIVKLACQEGKNELLSYFRHWKSTPGHSPYDSVLDSDISTHALARQTNSKRLLDCWLIKD